MDTKETIAILTTIKLAYPNAYKDISPDERKLLYGLWQKTFAEIPYQIMLKAVMAHIDESKYQPAIAEISEQINYIYRQAQNALDSHNRELKQLEEEAKYPDYYEGKHYKFGELLTEEQMAIVKETLRVCANREHRITQQLWQTDQKKLGGKQ